MPITTPWNSPPGNTSLDRALSFSLGPLQVGAAAAPQGPASSNPDVAAVTQPAPPLVPAVAGQAAAAAPQGPMPDVSTYSPSTLSTQRYYEPPARVTQSGPTFDPRVPLPPWNPNAPIDPAVVGVRPGLPPADPNASPFYQGVQQNQLRSAAEEAYSPIANQGNMFDRVVSFFSRAEPGQPTIDDRAAAGNFFSDPAVKQYVLSDANLFNRVKADPVGMHMQLAPIVAAAMNPSVAAHPNGAPVSNPAAVAAVAAATGADPRHVAAMQDPHHYSEQEFVNSMRGISRRDFATLMGMHLYQTPQQQAYQTLLGGYQQVADKAKADYDNAKAKGLPIGQQDELKAKADAANKQIETLIRNNAEPAASIPLGSMNIQ